MIGESLKQPSQRNQWTESNDLPEKLAPLPHSASFLIENLMLFRYNNLIHVFELSSVRNSNKFSFDTVTGPANKGGGRKEPCSPSHTFLLNQKKFNADVV